jgi:DNA mismatch repair protein MutS2
MARSVSPEGEILDSASPELRRLRQEQAAARQALVDKLRALVRSAEYSPLIRDDVITTRQDRFVIQVRAGAAGKNRGMVHDWSKTGATAYLEPLETIDDNNRLNFLRTREAMEIERVLLGLSAMCREASGNLSRDGVTLSYLDQVTASARMAVERHCSPPDYEPGKGYRLTGLRHPLLEERLRGEGREMTPLDFRVDPHEPMLVISGLNTGGKTIALKTLGLNALIARTGLFVHAKEGSAMDLPQEVLCVMGDNQDLESDLSTFSGHVKALRHVLSKARKGVLILLDELGNGTDPQEGAALALSVLEHLLTTGATVVSATHFHLVKAWAALTDGVVSLAVNASEDGAPSYGLAYGTPGFSGGLNMAGRLGLPPFLVDRARSFLDDGYRKANELLEKLDSELSKLKREREAMEDDRRELRITIDSQKAAHDREVERLNRDARASEQEIKMALNRYRREFEAIKEEFKRSQKNRERPNLVALSLKKASIDRELEEKRPTVIEQEELAPASPDLKTGDTVYIRKLAREGTVLSWNREKNEGVVESRKVRVKAELSDLAAPLPGKKKDDRAVLNIIATPGGSDLYALKLLGFTVDEALGEIDKEIDRAIISGRNKLTIIHGLGTGRLKSGIAAFLKKHPRVLEFGSPTQTPGGSGVTEVLLDN